MLAQVVSQSVNAAQVFFLIAVIVGAIATIVSLLPAPNIPFALVAGAVTFIALGLLFFAGPVA
jgi:flagellar biosynthesis component FlhA